MAYSIKNNNEKHDKRNNAPKAPRNIHVTLTKFEVVRTDGTKTDDMEGICNLLQSISYNAYSVQLTAKGAVLGNTEKPNLTTKIGFVNGFETHLEGEEFKISILGKFADVFKAIEEPKLSILIRTDRNTKEPVQVLGFEIIA